MEKKRLWKYGRKSWNEIQLGNMNADTTRNYNMKQRNCPKNLIWREKKKEQILENHSTIHSQIGSDTFKKHYLFANIIWTRVCSWEGCNKNTEDTSGQGPCEPALIATQNELVALSEKPRSTSWQIYLRASSDCKPLTVERFLDSGEHGIGGKWQAS